MHILYYFQYGVRISVVITAAHLVLGVKNHSLGVRDPADVVLLLGCGEPNSRRQLVVEKRQLRDQPLGLLLFGG